VADLFLPDPNQAVVLRSPALEGQYYPNIDGAQPLASSGYRVPWGGSATLNRLTATQMTGTTPAARAMGDAGIDLSSVLAPLSNFMQFASGQVAVGVPGPPGPPGPPGAYVIGATGPAGADGVDGSDGADAVAVYVRASGYVFLHPKTGGVTPSTLTLTCDVVHLSNPTYQWQYLDGTWQSLPGETNNTLSVSNTAFSGERTYRCLVDGTYFDSATLAHLYDGADGLNGADGVDGADGTSIVWKGEYTSHPDNPENGWAYRNSADGKSYVYYDSVWYQMTIDGVDGANGADGADGLSIVWKGDSASPPADPQENWAYRDTDNGYVYIYNGSAWELMVHDGSDGADGTDGLNVYITYHDNPASNPPAAPTGDGTTGGWHTDVTSSVVWISQKIAASASEGVWGTPLRISGTAIWSEILDDDGTKPADNADVTADSPVETFRENFDDPNNDFGMRWGATGPYSLVSTGGVAGGKILRCGDNADNDRVNILYHNKIPFDPDKLYRVKVRVRQTAGTGKFFFGIYGYQENGVTPQTASGSSAHWIVAYGENPGSSWVTYTGYFKGTSPNGDNTPSTDPANPATLHEAVRYFTFRSFINWPGDAGITEIDQVVLDVMPEDADQIPEGSTNKWAGESGADVTADHAGDIITGGATPPANPQNGHLWLDTSSSPHTLKKYNGSSWESAGTVGATWGVDIVDQPAGYLVYWKGTYTSHPASPQEGWAYYNSTDRKSYIYHDAAWYQMSADGVDGANGADGLSIVWKGELASPPASPETNWVYKDTDDGYAYIYNGTAWEPMVADGSDGADGADGSDGLSVFITYHDNPASSPPATPTGDGTTDGWHTDATGSVVWMSQKVAASASSGTWGDPVRIAGEDGTDGAAGTDAYTVLLTNEAHTVLCDSSGNPQAGELGAGGKAVSDVLAYKGTTQLTAVASNPGTGQFSISLTDSNTTSSKVDDDTLRCDTMTADSGHIEVSVNLEGLVTVTKRFSLTKAYAGTDAFANIDVPIPYNNWEGAFSNNSPSAGYVSWSSFKIKYQGSEYTVAANSSGTNAALVYWDANDTPTSLKTTTSLATAIGAGKFLVGTNDGGTFYPAQFCKVLHGGLITAGTIVGDHIAATTITAAKIAANAIETDKINGQAVTTPKIADGATTSAKSSNTSGPIGFSTSYTTVQTVSGFISSGGIINIRAQAGLKSDGTMDTAQVRIRRGTTTVFSESLSIGNVYSLKTFEVMDSPGVGVYTYTLEVAGTATSGDAETRLLSLEEALK